MKTVYIKYIYLLLKSYPKYKIDRDRNITHDTDMNIKKHFFKNMKSSERATHYFG